MVAFLIMPNEIYCFNDGVDRLDVDDNFMRMDLLPWFDRLRSYPSHLDQDMR